MSLFQRTPQADTPSRNSPCPCGSGRKFKQCCGATSQPRDTIHAVESDADLPAIPEELEKIRALREAGRLVEALKLARNYLGKQPRDALAHNELGLIHLSAARPTDAATCFQQAIQLAPNVALYQYNLGCALDHAGRTAPAIAVLRQTLRLDPFLTDALERLGNLLLNTGGRDEAVQLFRRAAAIAPDTLAGRLNHAKVLVEEAGTQETMFSLRQTLTLFPSSVEAKRFLAMLLRETGSFSEAIPLLEEATEGDPLQAATAYHDLALSKRVTTDDMPMLDQMQALLRLTSLPDIYRLRLHYGLGKAHDDLGEYAEAMQHFDAANRLASRSQKFDRAQFASGARHVAESFTQEFFTRHCHLGSSSDVPIMILGMPRSGTTLVEQVVSSHPEVGAGGELTFWQTQAASFARLRQEDVAAPWIEKAAADYLAYLHRLAPTAQHVTDKAPANFLWIGLIHLVFPKVRILHCRRNPVDTCLSNYFTNFSAPMLFTNSKADLAFYYRQYETLMAHWRSVLPPETLLDVDYEEMVAEPEAMSRRIIDFVGLPWNDACLRPQDNQRAVKTASMWQARQPMYRTSVARWRRYEPWLGELRELIEPAPVRPKFTRTLATLQLIRRAADRRNAGAFDEAETLLSAAAQESPNDPWVENEFGLARLARHDWPVAAARFDRAVALDPAFAFAWYNLGFAQERQRQAHTAIESYRRAVALAPDLTEAHSRLGNLLHAQGRREEALASFRCAAEASPETTLGRLNQVKLLIEAEDLGGAEAVLRRLLADDPNSSEAWRLLGNCLRESGRFAEAVPCLEQAIARDKAQVAAYHDLAQAKRISQSDQPLLAQMQTRLAGTDLTGFERVLLNFALGKSFDDLGKWSEAIKHFDAGNRMERAALAFDRAAFSGMIDHLIATFTTDRLAAAASLGNPSDLPLLVLGMPRSGTTLVEQILSSHPQVGAAGELRFWNEHADAALKSSDANGLRALAGDYLARLRQVSASASRITDKMPFNFLWAGPIHLALPNARIVHCRRNPVDTCLSIYFTRFATRQDFAYDRGDLLFYYQQYQRLMAHWRATLPASRFLDIDYETLVDAPEPAIRQLIDFAGLAWDDACLRPERNPRAVKTASMWQARQPVYRSSVARWRHYEPWLGELRQLLEDVAAS